MPQIKIGAKTDVSTYTLEGSLLESFDAAVEADGPDEQWQPEQHGNVVVVEPDLMFQHRRGKL